MEEDNNPISNQEQLKCAFSLFIFFSHLYFFFPSRTAVLIPTFLNHNICFLSYVCHCLFFSSDALSQPSCANHHLLLCHAALVALFLHILDAHHASYFLDSSHLLRYVYFHYHNSFVSLSLSNHSLFQLNAHNYNGLIFIFSFMLDLHVLYPCYLHRTTRHTW